MHYKYCPECGTKLIDRLAGDDGQVPYCETCEKYWFDSFASSSIILVANEFHEVVVLTQKYISDKYKTFVAGYMTPGETAEETAFREVKEEIGITLDRLEYAGTHWFSKKEILMHCFIGYAKKAEFVLSDEVDEAQWLPAEEVKNVIFPDSPDNAAFAILKKYLRSIGKELV